MTAELALHDRPHGCGCADTLVFGHGCKPYAPTSRTGEGYAIVPVATADLTPRPAPAQQCTECGYEFKEPRRRAICRTATACAKRAERRAAAG